jgi:hypothetical protein
MEAGSLDSQERRETHSKRRVKQLAIGALACGMALQAGVALARPAVQGTADAPTARTARESGQPVIDWDQVLLSIVRTPGAQPASIQSTRNFAILHAAIYDAVNSIDRSHEPYLVGDRGCRRRCSCGPAQALPDPADRPRRGLCRRALTGARRRSQERGHPSG